MPFITNDIELAAVLNEIVDKIMPIVQKNISEELHENILKWVYYEDYFPNKYYYNKTGIPTWQFLNSFLWKDNPISTLGSSKILYYAWETLSFDPLTALHGSERGGDARENLAEILDVEGYDKGIFGGKLRGAFWKNTMDDLLSGTIESWFKTQFANYGVIKT